MSKSALTRIPKFAGVGASLALAMCLTMAPLASQAADEEKVSFHFAPFSINDAQLFEFVAARLMTTEGSEQLDTLRDELQFARLGPDSFLVMARGFYLVEPEHGVFTRISPDWSGSEPTLMPAKLVARSP